jgi:protein-tyrosine phosphatase
VNFRDAGGLATADGHLVRRGLIFRSAELSHLTDQDFLALAPLHIHYIFDLRTDAERTASATHWTQDAPQIIPISVGFPAGEQVSASMQRLFANGTDAAHTSEAMKGITVRIAIDGAPEIGKILHDLASGDEPAIVHCTAGKDRTGVVIAVLLRILGVPQDAIYADYLRSNDAVSMQMAHLKSASAQQGAASPLAALPPDSIKVLMGVDRSYLEAAFAAMDERFGSFDGYVKDGLKLTPADVAALRSRLLEPAR